MKNTEQSSECVWCSVVFTQTSNGRTTVPRLCSYFIIFFPRLVSRPFVLFSRLWSGFFPVDRAHIIHLYTSDVVLNRRVSGCVCAWEQPTSSCPMSTFQITILFSASVSTHLHFTCTFFSPHTIRCETTAGHPGIRCISMYTDIRIPVLSRTV